MKTVFSMALALVLTAPAAFAQDTSSRMSALAWLKSHLAGQTYGEFHGLTKAGKPCALFLTDRSYIDVDDKGVVDYYVVVGYPHAKNMNDYIGMPVSQGTAIKSGETLVFTNKNSWGNDSKFNQVTINIDVAEKPVSAIGISDLQTIECQLY